MAATISASSIVPFHTVFYILLTGTLGAGRVRKWEVLPLVFVFHLCSGALGFPKRRGLFNYPGALSGSNNLFCWSFLIPHPSFLSQSHQSTWILGTVYIYPTLSATRHKFRFCKVKLRLSVSQIFISVAKVLSENFREEMFQRLHLIIAIKA